MSRALEGVVFWLLASIWVTHGVRLFDEQGFGGVVFWLLTSIWVTHGVRF